MIGLLSILLVLVIGLTYGSGDVAMNNIVIEVANTHKYPATLPTGSSLGSFDGYFVEITPDNGCSDHNTVEVEHFQPGEDNENTLVTYVNWYTSDPPCSFSDVLRNLQNATVKISHFILIVPLMSAELRRNVREDPSISSISFVILTGGDKDMLEFMSLVSQPGKMVPILVQSNNDNDDTASIPMSSMAILFVTVAFVTLMTVSIGWLVFYYAQRCRQRNMRERLQSRLCVAAKRAVGKLPTKTVPDNPKSNKKSSKKPPPSPDNDSTCSSTSSDDGDFCPVCLDLYKPREVIRILPCNHEFHKNCVDPWLFEHRTCPMCKLDILEHFGMLRGERVQAPHYHPDTSDHNMSLRVDQEVQTDFTNQPSHVVQVIADEIEPAPLSPH